MSIKIMKISIINGPNLNMLGKREPQHYGVDGLEQINKEISSNFPDIDLQFFQSNSESALIDHIHNLTVDYIIINPAAFTHTSVALRDAISSVAIPFYEVHLSNVHAREEFRHKSLFSDKAVAVICGLGKHGYTGAIEHIVKNN
jgi:3-dehydroquinate dehydratase-2